MEAPKGTSPPPSSIYWRASVAFARAWTTARTKTSPPAANESFLQLRSISQERQLSSLNEEPPQDELPDPQAIKDASTPEKTYLYLAYGSNLASSTFRGARGIRPLAALNVVVPELVLTFDLAGIPYTEPCFANTAYRSSQPTLPNPSENEKSPLLPATYKKDPPWDKGLVGVVYEVTPKDYAHIIATEGGGASYHDVLVTCHPLPPSSPTIPSHPTTQPFKAHTLYSPLSPPDGSNSPKRNNGGRFQRPDPNYAQPSRRYLDLLRTGAEEHGIPREYREYLDLLQPYTITTRGQRMGRFVLEMTWWPILSAVFGLNKVFCDKQGRSPRWLVGLLGSVFVGIWTSYDGWMKGVFGDGERTIDSEEEVGRKKVMKKLVKKRRGDEVRAVEKDGWVDCV
ncbi:MAG: hypothetical protein LQ343_006566 [Gyalolechia ehrenbergii]|nr:MAG: hypothetical protein LQ343_006566 [Gyalolechia ehrenbergii]